MILVYLFAVCLLTYWSAWISASETALFSLPETKIKAYRHDENPKKQLIATLLNKSRDLLVTIFMINTFLNIVLQNVASSFFGADASWTLKVGVPLVLTLVLGEIIPKYYGMQNNLSFSLRVAEPLDFIHRLLRPIRVAIVKVTTPISRALFFFLKKEESLSRSELEHLVKASEAQGLLQPDERLLVTGYLDLQDTEVKELMWPRGDMLTYDIQQPLTKLQHLFVDQEVTRLPVIDQTVDNMLGIIDAYTFFVHQSDLKSAQDLIPLLKKPQFVPETTPARTLLKKINKDDGELVLVVDEYGAITGLITREDLLEVVVGQIEDFRDVSSDYTRSSENEIIASGKMELLEFNEIFGSNFKSENNLVSLGGWLTEELGDIPKAGTKYEKSGFLFQVLASTPTHIERIYVRKEKHG